MPTRKSTDIRSGISPFLPEGSVDDVCRILAENPSHLRITKPRKTKLGDFRVNVEGKLHAISVNGNLNPYAFLITLLHEVAHLQTWDAHGRKAKPHGKEWKTAFRRLLMPFTDREVFPDDVSKAIEKYLSNPKASSCSDLNLMRALSRYDKKQPTCVEHLSHGDLFRFRGKEYVRGEKQRTRYRCELAGTTRVYLFNALTPVDPVENES